MKHTLLLCLSLLSLAAAGDDWKLPAEQPVFKAGAGAELVQANCLICHSAEYITTQPRFTRDQWKASVTKMQQKYAAPLVAENVESLLDYLVQSYGKSAVQTTLKH